MMFFTRMFSFAYFKSSLLYFKIIFACFRKNKFPTSLYTEKHFHIISLVLNIAISFFPSLPGGYANFFSSLSSQIIFPYSALPGPGHNRQSFPMLSTTESNFMNFAGCRTYHVPGHCIYNITMRYYFSIYSLVTMRYLSLMIYM